MYTQNRVIGQTEIIQKMKELGYKDANENGVCFGITHMMIQAILIGQRTEFEDRIRLIVETNDLKGAIEQAQERIKKELNLKERRERIEEIKKEGGEPSEEDLKLLKDFKLLDILSFFDGIMLYQYPIKSSEWFSKNIIQTQPLKVSKFVYPSILKEGSIEEGAKVELKEGGIVEVYSGSGIYTELELYSYLDELSKILKTLEGHDKIAVQIGCSNHSMLLTYDSKNERWNFFDPNQLLKEPVSAEEIVGAIMEGFDETPITVFNTKIYATKNDDDEYNIKERFHILHQIKEHEVNETRAKMKTNQSVNWLWIAVMYDHFNVVQKLLEKGAEINLVDDNEGWTALHLAVRYGHHIAEFNNNSNIVKFLLKKGASVDVPNNDGWTALHVAVRYGHLDVVKVLLEKGANVHLENKGGITPLDLAEEFEHPEIVKAIKEAILLETLIKEDTAVNLVDNDGETALHRAARDGHFRIIEFLLEKGANINMKNNDGWTALHLAAFNNNSNIVTFLLEKGAPIDVVNNYRWTALHVAAGRGYLEVVNALLERGANINMRNNNEGTALHVAAGRGYLEVVNALLASGANIDLKDKNGKTALELAKQNKHLEIVDAIKKVIASPKKISDSLILTQFSDKKSLDNTEKISKKSSTREPKKY